LKQRAVGDIPVNGAGEDADVPTKWTFLSGHAQVFLAIAGDPSLRMRDIAEHLGYTERMVQNLVRDLEATGYLTHTRVGRRNLYTVCSTQKMRHPLLRHKEVSALLKLLS
jgi:DNA-binding MarR family transcriptional regulator